MSHQPQIEKLHQANMSAYTETFKHRGRNYKIFKRTESKDAAWYCHYQFEGRRHLVCAKTNERANAVLFFRSHIDASWNGRLQALERERAAAAAPAWSTVGELIRGVEQAPLDIGATARRQYINCLRNALRRVKGAVDVDGLPVSVLDGDFVRLFFENSVLASQREGNQVDAKRVKRTANSVLNQAKALLRPKVVACLRRNGYVTSDAKRMPLNLPNFVSLEKAWREEKFEGVNKVEFSPPSDEVIEKTLTAWTKLADRNHFLAVGLELTFGLRKSEVSQARWGWLTCIEGQPFLAGAAEVKSGHGQVQVRALDPFWTVLRRRMAREGWEGKPGDYILGGTETERTESVFRAVGAWMRELGWETQKTNHAFRAYSGSQVAMRYGIYSAYTWLRHSSVTVTEQHYSHFIRSHKVDGPRQIRRRWARAQRQGMARAA